MSKIVSSIVLSLFVLTGCSKETKVDSKLIEYVGVEGVCYDINIKQPFKYVGRLKHSYIKTKRKGKDIAYHSRTGYLSRTIYDPVKEAIDSMKNPDKHYMPFNTNIMNIPEKEFSKPEMSLQATFSVTKQTARNQPVYLWKNGTPYMKAICELKVTKRLDHLPPEVVAERERLKRLRQ